MLHAVLACVILVIAAISGGDIVKAFVVAIAYFVVATGWSWFRFRQRESRTAGREKDAGKGGGAT
jgi:hypothetical protein